MHAPHVDATITERDLSKKPTVRVAPADPDAPVLAFDQNDLRNRLPCIDLRERLQAVARQSRDADRAPSVRVSADAAA
jgi:hypothetical protein